MRPAGSAAGADSALAFAGLCGGYGRGLRVLGPIDAELWAGELVALVGPNGAGKSTLLKAAVGGSVRVSGRVRLCGREVAGPARSASDARWRARRLAYVPQAGGVRFGFAVAEVLAMARYPHGDAGGPAGRAAVASAVDRCDLGPLLGKPFPSLSGGQQRRVLLGRGLAQADGGAVLLADEPTAGVDPGRADDAIATLRAAAAGGLAVLVTVHDLTAAWRYADRVFLMDAGRLRAAGPPEEVLDTARLQAVYRTGFHRLPGEAAAGAARGGAVLTAG